ncbi:MAG: MFS transporter [Nitrososphaerales archaeon]|nr:MFS transporter [Nitrososphaerales archaeon]
MAYKKHLYLTYASIFPLMICSGIVYSIFAIYIKEDLGASTSQIGLIFTLGSLSGVIAAPLFGRLSDRIGRKPILVTSMTIFFVVFLFYSLARSFLEIFPVQVLEGVGWSSLGATTSALIADTVPSETRGTAMGMYTMTWYLGWVIGPALGGWMAETFGFRSVFFICSILIIFGFVMALKFIKEPIQKRPRHNKGVGEFTIDEELKKS